MENTLEIKLLSKNAIMPKRANPTDSGLDLYVSETITIPAHTTTIVKTDIAINLPYGYEGQVRPRSGKSLKTKLRVALGTIDKTYHKEIGIITDN
ncbi:dUTP diphosphatase, partial [Streptococcus anginosus]